MADKTTAAAMQQGYRASFTRTEVKGRDFSESMRWARGLV